MGQLKYKILIINWQDIKNPQSGGAEVHLHEIFKRVAARGHEVTLLCCSFKGAPAEEIVDGLRVIRKGRRYDFNFVVPTVYLSMQNTYDVLIEDINKIPFYTPLYARSPVLGIVHHLFGEVIFQETNRLFGSHVYLSERLIPIVYRQTPFMVVSESTSKELRDQGLTGEIMVIPNCVDHETYKSTGIKKSNYPLILFLGRLKKYKRVDILLRAMKIVSREIPDARLVVVGIGDHLDSLKRLSVNLGLGGYVDFTGYIGMEKKVELLQQAHVVVNTSSKEGWGLTVLEANACGTPVIASNVPGLRDAVVDGETGLLFEFGNVEQLAQRIISVLTNLSLRDKLINNAVRWASKFNWDESAEKTLQFIRRVIQTHSPRCRPL